MQDLLKETQLDPTSIIGTITEDARDLYHVKHEILTDPTTDCTSEKGMSNISRNNIQW